VTKFLAGAIAAVIFLLSAHARADDWPSLDLTALAAGDLPEPVSVAVDDPVYRERKNYEGYPLAAMLARLPGLDDLRSRGAVAIFEAADGYKAVMSLENALAQGGVIARRDLDAPAGEAWLPFMQGKERMTPAPYYLVWPERSHADWTFVWPYQLVRISVQPFAAAFGAAAPPDGAAETARKGFDLFRTYCLRCHSVNLAGGELAPELNVPRNIGDYWPREHLRAFILDPAQYRARSKMPSFRETLSEDALDAILAYLALMADHKVCGGEKDCD
jgi:mono/diheme cytochrome c family protein